MKKVLVSFLLFLISFVVYPHDYFPIAVGNEWVLSDHSSSSPEIFTMKIESDTVILGKHIFKMNQCKEHVVSFEGKDSLFKDRFIYYLFTAGDDIYTADSLDWYNWKKSFYKHSYKNGEEWGFSYIGAVATARVEFAGTVGRYDSCFQTFAIPDTTTPYIYAPDIGLIKIGKKYPLYLDTFIQGSTSARPGNGRYVFSLANASPADGREILGAYTVNGRTISGKLFNSPVDRVRYSSLIMIVRSKNQNGSIITTQKNVFIR
jgi:hypothetical protein